MPTAPHWHQDCDKRDHAQLPHHNLQTLWNENIWPRNRFHHRAPTQAWRPNTSNIILIAASVAKTSRYSNMRSVKQCVHPTDREWVRAGGERQYDHSGTRVTAPADVWPPRQTVWPPRQTECPPRLTGLAQNGYFEQILRVVCVILPILKCFFLFFWRGTSLCIHVFMSLMICQLIIDNKRYTSVFLIPFRLFYKIMAMSVKGRLNESSVHKQNNSTTLLIIIINTIMKTYILKSNTDVGCSEVSLQLTC